MTQGTPTEPTHALHAEVQEFTGDLFRSDEMTIVVRAQIRIENELIKFTEAMLPKPQHRRTLGLDFDGLVTLSLALGLKDQFGPPLRALGKLRNDFAHKLGASITQQTTTNFYNAFDTAEKDHIQASFLRIKNDNPETASIGKFKQIEPVDQFKLMAMILWTAMKQASVSALNPPGASDGR